MKSRNCRFAIAALAVLCAAAICAQTPKPQTQSATPAAFEVASVKRNSDSGPPGDIPANSESSPGHFTMRDKPLRYILEWAYDLKDFQIVGPEWIKIDDRFDIVANAPGPATNDQMRPMLQTLLTERFQMKSHIEKREMSVYALVPGKGEPKLKKADPNSMPSLNNGFHNFPLSRMTFMLTRRMDRPVLDLTGILGNYDWTVDLSGLGRGMGSSGYDGEGRSVFQAIQEDMGLKLEPRKWPVDVLVIDSVSKVPTEN